MQVAPLFGLPIYQAARAAFVSWIILNDYTIQQCLRDVAGGYPLVQRLLVSMERQVDAASPYRFPDLLQAYSAYRRRSSSTRSAMGTRSWAMVSRSRMVTFLSSSVSKSTVTQSGVPTSSCRR